MEYKIKDLIDEEGKIKKLPRGYSAIVLKSGKIFLFNEKYSIVIVRVDKNTFAISVSNGKKTYYEFLSYDDEIIKGNKPIIRRGNEVLLKALDYIIGKLEEVDEIDKSKDIIFYMYLIKGCVKGDKSSCNELEDLIYYETIK